MNSATNGMLENATGKRLIENTGTCAGIAGKTTGKETAKQSKVLLEPCAKRPRYTCGLLWDDDDNVLSPMVSHS
jgi:hypothetical protein